MARGLTTTAALLLALLGGTSCCRRVCAPAPEVAAPRKAAPADVTIAKVHLIDGCEDFEGICMTSPSSVTQIQVRAGLGTQREAVVLAHELGHALGLGHSDDPRSIMFWTGGDLRQCPAADADTARAATHPMSVTAKGCDPEAFRLAVAYWNDALGRTQFVVRP